MMQPKQAITINEAAQILSCSRDTIDRLCERGELDRIKLGKAVRITMKSINKLIERRESQ